MAIRVGRALVVVAALAVCGAGCGDSQPPNDRLHDAGSENEAAGPHDDRSAAGRSVVNRNDAGARPEHVTEPCVPAVASDGLRARSNTMARAPKTAAAGVFTSDLFGVFASNCGGCHVDNSLGGFHVTAGTFATTVTEKALARITSDDPKFFMPPSNREPFSKLGATDPLVELARLLKAWLAAGRPESVFYPATAGDGAGDAERYLLSEEVGTHMTNLGNCIPQAKMVLEAPDADDDLDAMFEKAEALPDRLEETDLKTLDAEALARQGVVAFAPGVHAVG